MSQEVDRSCPECGETLAKDARQCACGWGRKKLFERSGKVYDHRCTFHSYGDRCEYPCAVFLEGATSGWCIFHRNAPLTDGDAIVKQSQSVCYADAIKPIQARNNDTPSVRALREQMAARRGDPQRIGAMLPEREPGADEEVA